MEGFFKSSGYFRQKAERVRIFIDTVQEKSNGNIHSFLKGPLPHSRRTLLSLKGIGPETADSMLLYGMGKSIFVVDAYTRRIGTRWGFLRGNESYDDIQKKIMDRLPQSANLYGEFHALLVELAKNFCTKTPKCDSCPVNKRCRFGKLMLERANHSS